jgi:signal transduction histidine kinase
MRNPRPGYLIFLLLTLLIFLFSIPAVYHMHQKADLPVTVLSSDNTLIIKSIRNSYPVSTNDVLISIDGIPVTSREHIEIIMDSKIIGTEVLLKVSSNGTFRDVTVTSVPFYSNLFLILQSFTAFVFMLFGLFVLIKARGNKAAKIFHLASLGAAVIMIMTWGRYSGSVDLGFITRGIFQAAYAFTPLLFVHFALSFPQDNTGKFKYFIRGLYFTGFLITAVNLFTFSRLSSQLNTVNINNYISSFNLSRYLLAASVLISITIFFSGYFKTKDQAQKKKLKWLITGFLTGPLSFIVLWVIPQSVTDYGLIPEEFFSLLMLAVPITFTISILKYQLLDIDLIISRSLIYSLVVAGIFLLYFTLVLSVSWFIHDINRTLISSISAVMVAFLFNPLRNYIHGFVNRKFFRIQYNFRQAVKSYFSEMKEINDINTLSNNIITGICRFIPVEKMALLDITDIYSPKILSFVDFNESDLRFFQLKIINKYDFSKIIIIPEMVDSDGEQYEYERSLKEININVILAAHPVDGKMELILAAGNKRSGSRYSAEDLDLLQNILNTASAVMTRIKLQADLFRKELEAIKLKELHEQRSLFLSSVTHDLKTPLTSIRMYSELIKMNEKIDKNKLNIYAEYIEGESERLTRLVNNVLNFSSIEKGIKEYHKQPVDLNELARKSICIMEYQIKLKNFLLITDISEKEMLVCADPDDITEAFINIISNALKYSLDKKEMLIKTYEEADNYIISFKDYGIGMSEEEQKKLFTPFFRTAEAHSLKIAGTGLGMSIVKNIADAHNILIKVYSRQNEGTTFKLIVPKLVNEVRI